MRSESVSHMPDTPRAWPEPVQKCHACGGLVLFYPRDGRERPHIACDNCPATYADLREHIGWLDAKFREDEDRQADLVRMYLSEVLQRLNTEELTDLYAEGWFGDVMNVVVKLRRASEAGPILEICHDLQHAAEQAFGVPS
jgi:hypothetical protein